MRRDGEQPASRTRAALARRVHRLRDRQEALMNCIARTFQIGILVALPVAAWAQAAPHQPPDTGGMTPQVGASGSSSNGLIGTPPVTSDTRTPQQEKARKLDQSAQPMPGDEATPGQQPNVAPPIAPGNDSNPELNPSSDGKQATPKAAPDDQSDLRQQDQLDSDK
jgi:hypothetical protein